MVETKREEYSVDDTPEPISHYCDAVRFGDLVYISGCGPLDADLTLVGGDNIKEQTRATLVNIGKVLSTVGATFGDVLKVTVYLTDVSELKAVDTVRREFFGNARPASTLVEVAGLAVPGMRIEIEAVVGLRRNAAG
jgi:2-iminobutanoate/2-iminopropanoate deaminase